LNEDLGIVDIFFSDKTGTLTRNHNKYLRKKKYSEYIVISKENRNICIYLYSSQKLIKEYLIK